MVVFEDDIKQGLDPLPVRSGCGMMACGCTGNCKRIIGWIGFAQYTEFLANYISKQKFLESNFIKDDEIDQLFTERNYIIRIHHSNDDRIVKYKLLKKLEKDLEYYMNVEKIDIVGDYNKDEDFTIKCKSHKILCVLIKYLRDTDLRHSIKRVLKDREDNLSFEEEYTIS